MSYGAGRGSWGGLTLRRRFSLEQKLAVLSEARAPGTNMSQVARHRGLLPQVCKWRRLAELGAIDCTATNTTVPVLAGKTDIGRC